MDNFRKSSVNPYFTEDFPFSVVEKAVDNVDNWRAFCLPFFYFTEFMSTKIVSINHLFAFPVLHNKIHTTSGVNRFCKNALHSVHLFLFQL